MSDAEIRRIRNIGPMLLREIRRTLAEDKSLDAAWAEAEAALPEGWRIRGVARAPSRDPRKWMAQARRDTRLAGSDLYFSHARGDSPAAALRALAVKLHAHNTNT